MGYDLVVRRPDRQPLGGDEYVRSSIAEAFPAIVFALEGPEESYWCGSFEGPGFAVQFYFPPGPSVELVELTIWGVGDPETYFDKLSKATGWIVDN